MNEIEKALWEYIYASKMTGDELMSALNDCFGARFTDLLNAEFAQHLVDDGIADESEFPFLNEDEEEDDDDCE